MYPRISYSITKRISPSHCLVRKPFPQPFRRHFSISPIPKMPPKDKYTDPKLRDQVKEEIHNSDKGGAPGQWSARKAQMMASEYKKRGGSVGPSLPSSPIHHTDIP